MILRVNFLKTLEKKCLENNIVVSETILENILKYLELLIKWNKIHNLTGIQDPTEMIDRHILESLSLATYLEPHARILDVGTGAGLPGLPLGILRSDLKVVLIDSVQKKINFVEQVILSLELKNCESVCMRVEAYQPKELFDWVISRAFASLSDFIKLSGKLCKETGSFLAMKGQYLPEEYENLPQGYRVQKVIERAEIRKTDPDTKARCLVFIEKK